MQSETMKISHTSYEVSSKKIKSRFDEEIIYVNII